MAMSGPLNPAVSGYSPQSLRNQQPFRMAQTALAAGATAGGALNFPTASVGKMPGLENSPLSIAYRQLQKDQLASPLSKPNDSLNLSAMNRPLSSNVFPASVSGLANSTAFKPSSPFSPVPALNGVSGFPFPAISATNVSRPAGFPSPVSSPGAAANVSAQAVGALSPAEETGKKVGALVTQLLEDAPALQEKLGNVDFEALSQDLQPKLERSRVAVQQAIKPLPKWVDRKMTALIDDPSMKELATDAFEWLRKEPDPAVLAELNRPKVKPNAKPNANATADSTADQALDGLEEPSLEGLDEADPLAETGKRRHNSLAEDEPAPKRSLLKRMRTGVSDRYNHLKDRFRRDKSANKPDRDTPHSVGQKRRGKPPVEDEISNEDLDALLNNAFSRPRNSGPSVGTRAHDDTDL